jgi:peroxiredoxin
MKKSLSILLIALTFTSMMAQNLPKGLSITDKAPDFSAKDQNGKPISLKEELKKGSLVLIFYRGEWCPYCNKQLKCLEDSLAMITKKGANLVAVTPESKENVSKTIAKTKATYSIISDDNLKIMKEYKVDFTVDEKTTAMLKGYGVNLAERNSTNGNNLPVPAVYIINKEGKITYTYFDADYKKRLSVSEILSHL